MIDDNSVVRENLKNNNKINLLQLDPFGYCNAKCWFCPVKYQPAPIEGKVNMSPELLEKIIANIIEERDRPDGLVDPGFHFLYTAHYNEVLLYKHFEEMLQILRKYKLKTTVLSNGIPLNRERTDIINNYQDVVAGIALNVPAFERNVWSKRAGFAPELFDKLLSNIQYASDTLYYLINTNNFSIQINGVNTESFNNHLTKGHFFDSLEIDIDSNSGELANQFNIAKELFPKLNIYKASYLIDRSGSVSDFISNEQLIKNNLMSNGRQVIGCTNMGDRTTNWMHVNAAGDLFLCCNDYNFDHKFASLKDNTLREVWATDKHVEAIVHAFKTICTKCSSAKTA